jgi:hypothetical protein
MSDVEQTQEENTVVATPAKEPVVRRVLMENGQEVNFGARSNLLSPMDVETGTLTFLISTGKVVTWAVEKAAEISDKFIKQAFLYGLREKIKSNLAGEKDLTKLPAIIAKQIEELKKGEFALRRDGEAPSLSPLQIAYAIAKSIDKKNPIPGWANTSDPVVVQEVLNEWATFDKTRKNAIRKHPVVIVELAKLQAAGAEDGIEL